ncbi:ATP-dependent helicase [Rubrivirga litoralis]|uniref:DNA 3'-5' helicase n=1 Tax=Rubrivirga litoralis TaxID=3075598 RepID=A0ABU3BRY5_9BACT|nr:UvrD-helicase domain-containing protein [Rubrivirga sp. F394]MDT0632034.1 3'-5' exonuclease [Rubrivirga sp. F394]
MKTFALRPPPDGGPDRPAPPTASADDGAVEALLGGLNPAQQEAAGTTEGPVMIIAGPGSGKTRTLTHRVAVLIAAKKAWPSQILALTFTNKAAREMRARVTDLVGDEAKGMWMGTFHSVFSRVLRREADKIGFSRNFTIYDSDDTERLLKELMTRYGVDPKRVTPRSVRSAISGAKNAQVGPDEYARLAGDPFTEAAARLYAPYNAALRQANAMDFDDLLGWPIRLFEQHPDVLKEYQRRWRYLHIDEYQDTNRTQYVLAKLLAAEHRNICVVGDDAQSIYAFRGADIQNILSFQKDYPEAKTIRLEQNYRSTQRIVRLADAVISGNTKQLDKTLWTDNSEGDPVILMEALSERDEAQKVERTIRDLRSRSGIGWSDVAVLYRTNAQSRSIEEALRRGGIPYRLVGGVSFYQRKEIKDALAYLRLAVNPSDEASLLRVVNTPTRGIGGKTVDQLRAYATEHRVGLWQAVQDPGGAGLSARAAKAVEGFGFLVSRFASKAQTAPADELARELIQETGLLQSYRDQNTPEALARLENIHELLNAVAEFAGGDPSGEPRTLSEFLQEVSLVADVDRLGDDDNRVTLMTLHASKGLEFKVVFVTGLEEGLFPLAKAAQDPTELEEERRLLYVGVTRAEEALYLSYARSRYRYGDQQSSVRSRFLDELDGDDLLRTESGGRFEARAGRFEPSAGGTGGYGDMSPDYWKRSLRPDSGPKRKTKRVASGEREVVYDEGESAIVPGVRVHHRSFGNGKVLAVEGAGERAAATVFFNSVGQKKLKLAFARLQVVE